MSRCPEGWQYTRPGRFQPALVGLLTFVCLFWNGIVGVFVMVLLGYAPTDPPMSDGRQFLFWFLIPFELVGLAIIISWLHALTMPWSRETLLLGPTAIEWSRRALGLTRIRRLAVADLAQARARHHPPTHKSTLSPNRGDWQLALLDKDQKPLLNIQPLTEGEARWLAAEITLRCRLRNQ